jgi:membrane protease YdiL (CAAX protease family)
MCDDLCRDTVPPSNPPATAAPRLLALEFAILYGLPPIVAVLPWRVNPLPLLWLATLYCLCILRADPEFDRSRLNQASALGKNWLPILALFAAVAVVVIVLVHKLERPQWFALVRSYPWLWAVIMVLYPLLSVYPQGIVYRVFLFHRYRRWVRGAPALVLTSAAAFSLAHVLFHNRLAVACTFAGGLLFAWRYLRTGSLLVSAFEHALYGCLMFTVGLGRYFYHAGR